MTLTFYPDIFPGELLYSANARFGILKGYTSPKTMMADLYGRKNAIATTDLPNNIGELLAGIPFWSKRPMELLQEHTLFRYYTAFQPVEQRQLAFDAMLGSEGSVHFLLGASVFRTGRPTHLHFCPSCMDEQESEVGLPYWRVDHQLPGVMVCHFHSRRLRIGGVKLQAINRHAHVAALRRHCPSDAEPIVHKLHGRELELVKMIAGRSAELVRSNRPPKSYQELRNSYRGRLYDLGFVKGRHKVRQQELRAAFVDHFGTVLDLMQGTRLIASYETWLNSIVRSSSGAHSPLHHVLVELFLEAMERSGVVGSCIDMDTALIDPAAADGGLKGQNELDWKEIDREHSIEIRKQAYRLQRSSPPIRVTAASIQRNLNKGRNWLEKRCEKLPVSLAAMNDVAEQLECFQTRRMRWHVRACLERGEDDPWIVMRVAGLPKDHIGAVRRELQSQATPRPRLAVAA